MDLNSKKWSTDEARRLFNPGVLRPPYAASVFRATKSRGGAGRVYAKVCTGCGHVVPLETCPECGHDGFVPGRSPRKVAALYCFECSHEFTAWSCKECGAVNPVHRSLGRPQRRGVLALLAWPFRALARVVRSKS